MARRYTQIRRAQNQAETRRRIVTAAVDLHATLGPVRTSISAVAERAGVQRHTVYAHFPTERDLGLACSAMAIERDPLPDERAWLAVSAGEERLRVGLDALYRWYARNENLMTCVLRDAEFDTVTQELVDLRMGQRFKAYERMLLGPSATNRAMRAALVLAMKFATWRTLARDEGLSLKAAVDLMACAVRCAGQ